MMGAIDSLSTTLQGIDENLNSSSDSLENLINTSGVGFTYNRESKLTYLAIDRKLIKSEELKRTYYSTPPWAVDDESNLLVYSIKLKTFSLNSRERLAKAKIKIYYCSSEEEYQAFMDALLLGADLSNLWSKP